MELKRLKICNKAEFADRIIIMLTNWSSERILGADL